MAISLKDFKPNTSGYQVNPVSLRDFSATNRVSLADFQPTQEKSTLSKITESKAFKAISQSKPAGILSKGLNYLSRPFSAVAAGVKAVGQTVAAGIQEQAIGVKRTDSTFSDIYDEYIKNSKDAWAGRGISYSDITNELTDKEVSKPLRMVLKTTGYIGDFVLDPINKLKVLSLTKKGIEAAKVGEKGLSLAEQAQKGERVLVDFMGAQVKAKPLFTALTKTNDYLRTTKVGEIAVKTGKVMPFVNASKIRDIGVSREEWKVIQDAIQKAKNIEEVAKSSALTFAGKIAEKFKSRKPTQFEKSQLLHAIEKGEERLAPVGFEDIWEEGVNFKSDNEVLWKKLGGSIVDGHGLSHVATEKVAEALKDETISKAGNMLFGADTPLDISREYVKLIDTSLGGASRIVKLSDEGIKYGKQYAEKKRGELALLQAVKKEKQKKVGITKALKANTVEGTKLRNIIKTRSRWASRLASEVRSMNIKGLNLSLKKDVKKTAGKKVSVTDTSAIRKKNIEDKIAKVDARIKSLSSGKATVKRKTETIDGVAFSSKRVEKISPEDATKRISKLNELKSKLQEQLGKVSGGKTFSYAQLSPAETKSFVSDLFSMPDKQILNIQKRIASKDEKLKKVVDEIVELRNKAKQLKVAKTGINKAKARLKYEKLTFGKKKEERIADIQTMLKNVDDEQRGAFYDKSGNILKVQQATAQEINNYLVNNKIIKDDLFTEELPTVVAKMGIATGKKHAGVEFLKMVESLKVNGEFPDGVKKLITKTENAITRNSSLQKFFDGFDKIQNVFKAQALLAPSYHIRNMAGNFWNNYLADVKPVDYAVAGAIQKYAKYGYSDNRFTRSIGRGIDKALAKRGIDEKKMKEFISEMKEHTVIGEGFYGKDIPEKIEDSIRGGSYNPLTQRFKGYKANKAVGELLENNARIAHYVTKRLDGYAPKQAAESVKKFLFDYSELTPVERGVFKRVMPFYTWMSKNIPLQVEQLIQNPSKFVRGERARQDYAKQNEQPSEKEYKYMAEYIRTQTPLPTGKDKNGNYRFILLGQWLPSYAAFQILDTPAEVLIGGLTPLVKIPTEFMTNQSLFMKDSLGDYKKIERLEGEQGNYLGVDMRKKYINVLRSIRILNEIDKLNPGEIFGDKGEESLWKKLGLASGSQSRGNDYVDSEDVSTRIINLIVGKQASYNPDVAKRGYSYDTKRRIDEYEKQIKDASRKKQTERVKKLRSELSEFVKSR